MDGLMEQSAFHVLRAWHALACLQALERGDAVPPFSDYKMDVEATPIASRVKKAEAAWRESMSVTRQLAATLDLTEPMLRELATSLEVPGRKRRERRKRLEFQIRLAEEAHHKLQLKQRFARLQQRLSRRAALALTGGLVLLVVGAVLALAIPRGSEEDTRNSAPSEPAKPPPPPILAGPALLTTTLEKVSKPVPDGVDWKQAGNIIFYKQLKVTLGKEHKESKANASMDNNDSYQLTFSGKGKVVGKVMVPKPTDDRPGMRAREISVPPEAVEAGYDKITVEAIDGDGAYSLGHLILSD